MLANFLADNDKKTLDATQKTTTGKQFNDLLQKLKEIHEKHGVSLCLINDLFIYKDHLLNPFSHDNLTSGAYKGEIEKVLSIIPRLNILTSEMLKEVKNKNSIIKFKDFNKDGVEVEYHIYLKENLRRYTLLDEKQYLSRGAVIALKEVKLGVTKDLGNDYEDIYKCIKRIYFFLDTPYPNDDNILLSKLDLS